MQMFLLGHMRICSIDPSMIAHRLNIDRDFKLEKQKWRAFNQEWNEIIASQVDDLLKAKFIREIQYLQWLSNIVLVKKANEKCRICTNFTVLNKACSKDSFRLPMINQLVQVTAGHEMVSCMYAYLGYNQIKMYAPDQEKTSFITSKGLYWYTVMSFGLKNAGATYPTYQIIVNSMFALLIWKNMKLYVNDMLVKSIKVNQHEVDLKEAF